MREASRSRGDQASGRARIRASRSTVRPSGRRSPRKRGRRSQPLGDQPVGAREVDLIEARRPARQLAEDFLLNRSPLLCFGLGNRVRAIGVSPEKVYYSRCRAHRGWRGSWSNTTPFQD